MRPSALSFYSPSLHTLHSVLNPSVKGDNKGDVRKILTISSQDRTRNNGYKLEKCRYNKEIGRNWFTNRVVDD